MKLRMVGRLRWVSWSEKVKEFAQALIGEALPDLASLDTEFGSKLLDRFVHLAPDATMEHLERLDPIPGSVATLTALDRRERE